MSLWWAAWWWDKNARVKWLPKSESMCTCLDSGTERQLARPVRGTDAAWRGRRFTSTAILSQFACWWNKWEYFHLGKYSTKPPFHLSCYAVGPVLRVCLQGRCWAQGKPSVILCCWLLGQGLLEVLWLSFFLRLRIIILKLLILYISALRFNHANTL